MPPSCWPASTRCLPLDIGASAPPDQPGGILDQVWITTSGIFTEPPFLAALATVRHRPHQCSRSTTPSSERQGGAPSSIASHSPRARWPGLDRQRRCAAETGRDSGFSDCAGSNRDRQARHGPVLSVSKHGSGGLIFTLRQAHAGAEGSWLPSAAGMTGRLLVKAFDHLRLGRCGTVQLPSRRWSRSAETETQTRHPSKLQPSGARWHGGARSGHGTAGGRCAAWPAAARSGFWVRLTARSRRGGTRGDVTGRWLPPDRCAPSCAGRVESLERVQRNTLPEQPLPAGKRPAVADPAYWRRSASYASPCAPPPWSMSPLS